MSQPLRYVIVRPTEHMEEWSLSLWKKLHVLSMLMMQSNRSWCRKEASDSHFSILPWVNLHDFTPWRTWHYTIQETRGKSPYILINKFTHVTNDWNTYINLHHFFKSYISLFHSVQGNKFPFKNKFQPLVLTTNKDLKAISDQWCPDTIWIQEGHAKDMAGTWILHIKSF